MRRAQGRRLSYDFHLDAGLLLLVLAVTTDSAAPELSGRLQPLGYEAMHVGQRVAADDPARTDVRYRMRWSQTIAQDRSGELFRALGDLAVMSFEMEIQEEA